MVFRIVGVLCALALMAGVSESALAADWPTPAVVSGRDQAEGPTFDYDAAVGSGGAAASTWMDHIGLTTGPVHVRRRPVGGDWGALETVSGLYSDPFDPTARPEVVGSGSPAVAVDARGGTLVVWEHTVVMSRYKAGDGIWFAYAPAGRPFSAPSVIWSDEDGYSASPHPRVAFGPDGTAGIIWKSGVGDVWQAVGRPTTGFSVSKIARTPDPRMTWPDLVSGPDGTMVATWVDFVGGAPQVANATVIVRRPGGRFGLPQTVAAASDGSWATIAPGIAGDGSAVVILRSTTTGVIGFEQFVATLAANADRFAVPRRLAGADDDVVLTTLAMGADGAGYAVGIQDTGVAPYWGRLAAKPITTGGKLEPSVPLTGGEVPPSGDNWPEAAVGPSGDLYAAWGSQTDRNRLHARSEVWTVHAAPGRPADPAIRLAIPPEDVPGVVGVAVFPNGEPLVSGTVNGQFFAAIRSEGSTPSVTPTPTATPTPLPAVASAPTPAPATAAAPATVPTPAPTAGEIPSRVLNEAAVPAAPASAALPAITTCRIPDVRGLTVRGAKRRLLAAHCRLGAVGSTRRGKHARVARQNTPGAVRASGFRVRIVVTR